MVHSPITDGKEKTTPSYGVPALVEEIPSSR